MTILGKILVIVNLIFSLVTGFLIVTAFVTRTNWKDGFDKLKKSYEVSVANSRAFYQEAQDAKTAAEGEVKKARDDVSAAKKEQDRLTKDITDKQAQLQAVEARVKSYDANIAAATEEINRRKQEIDNLKKVTADKEERIVRLEAQSKQFRDDAIGAEITSKNYEERNRSLLQQLETLNKDNDRSNRFRGSGSPFITTLKPPSDDVQGTILDVDAQAGLVTISLGTNMGVVKNNTLDVWRTVPRPQYLGTLLVLDAREQQAVVRPMQPLRASALQKGDSVGSRVLAPRGK